MTNTKTIAPIVSMDDEQYKLSYFSESLSEFELKHVETVKQGKSCYTKLRKWYKKDILHIETVKPVCPECHTNKVIKNNLKDRILFFMKKEKLMQKYRVINVKNVVKLFSQI